MFTRRSLFCGIAAIALFAVAVTAGKPQPPPPPPADPAILYNMSVPYKGNDYNIATDYSICVMNEDGSNQTKLVSVSTHGIAAMAANWAPDNRTIAFAGVDPDNHWKIYVAEIDTTAGIRAINLRWLYRNPVTYWAASNPGWSADGKWVFFHNDIELVPGRAQKEIFAIRADGTGGPLRLTFTEDRDESTPSADSSGAFIAYKGGAGLYVGMLAWDTEGRPSIVDEIPLTDTGPLAGLNCTPPKISPDGTRIHTLAGGSFWVVPVDFPGTASQCPTPVGATRGGSWLDEDTIVYPAERPLSTGRGSLVFIGKCGVNDTSNETILASVKGPSNTVSGPNARWWGAP